MKEKIFIVITQDDRWNVTADSIMFGEKMVYLCKNDQENSDKKSLKQKQNSSQSIVAAWETRVLEYVDLVVSRHVQFWIMSP